MSFRGAGGDPGEPPHSLGPSPLTSTNTVLARRAQVQRAWVDAGLRAGRSGCGISCPGMEPTSRSPRRRTTRAGQPLPLPRSRGHSSTRVPSAGPAPRTPHLPRPPATSAPPLLRSPGPQPLAAPPPRPRRLGPRPGCTHRLLHGGRHLGLDHGAQGRNILGRATPLGSLPGPADQNSPKTQHYLHSASSGVPDREFLDRDSGRN